MRILHLGKYYPPVPGGMERFLADLVEAQRRAGDEVAVLVHDEPRAAPRDDPAWLMRCPTWVRLIFAPISPSFPFWLRRAIQRHDPEVLHIHMPNLSAFWAMLLPSARRIPWIVHWQSDVEPSKFKLSLRLAYPHYRIFERALLEQAAAIVATSPQYLEASKALRPWLDKCHVVPLGVLRDRLPDTDPEHGNALWRPEGLRVLAVGRLAYYKGFDTLIRAVARDPNKQLLLIGSGEERARLERLVAQIGDPPNVRLHGGADDATVTSAMASCDVLCLPSLERTEAFGIVLLEAMRYGKPLVVSDLAGSGVTSLARAGENALLVPPGDVDALSRALDFLDAHPRERAAMGRLGQERYTREFDVAHVARTVRGVYQLTLRMAAEDMTAQATSGELDDVPDDVGALRSSSGKHLVVIPALNEAACIGEVISQVRANGVDVLVVDDGSSDDTAAIALANGATVIRAPLWQGAWGAIQSGIRYALRHGYSAVITMDADGQHEPIYLPALMQAASEADVVIAACPSRGSRLRHIAWSYFRFLTGFTIDDLTSGFRYYNARACRLLAGEEATLLDYQDIGVLLLLRHARLRIAEIPVAMNPRKYGPSRVFSSWWTVAWYMAETTLLCLARWNPGSRKTEMAITRSP